MSGQEAHVSNPSLLVCLMLLTKTYKLCSFTDSVLNLSPQIIFNSSKQFFNGANEVKIKHHSLGSFYFPSPVDFILLIGYQYSG